MMMREKISRKPGRRLEENWGKRLPRNGRERGRKRENTVGENREIVRRMRGGLRRMKLRRKEETREDPRWEKKENAGEIRKTGRAPAEARRKFRGRDDRKRNT